RPDPVSPSAHPRAAMRKARSSKEKAHEAEVEAPEADDTDTAAEDVKPRRGKARAGARAAEEPERPAKRRAARKDGPEEEPDARERADRDDERERAERDDEDGASPRPVLTAIPRPVRDDDLQGVGTSEGTAAQLPPPPSTPEAPRLEPVREGAP